MQNNHKRKICVSGVGVISPLGTKPETFWENLNAGKSGIKKTKIFNFPVDPNESSLHVAAPLIFEPLPGLEDVLDKNMYWGDRLLCHSAQMALDDAGIDTLPKNTAVFIGGGASTTLNIEDYEKQLAIDVGQDRFMTSMPKNLISSENLIANRYGLYGRKNQNELIGIKYLKSPQSPNHTRRWIWNHRRIRARANWKNRP